MTRQHPGVRQEHATWRLSYRDSRGLRALFRFLFATAAANSGGIAGVSFLSCFSPKPRLINEKVGTPPAYKFF